LKIVAVQKIIKEQTNQYMNS